MFELFENIGIRLKLTLSFMTLILLPLIVLLLVSFHNIEMSYGESTRYNARQSFEQAYELMSYRIKAMVDSSNMVYSDLSIQNVLNRDSDKTDIHHQINDFHILEQFLFNIEISHGVYRVILYVPNWMIFSGQGYNYSDFNQFQNTVTYKNLVDNGGMLWISPEVLNDQMGHGETVISMLRAIRDVNSLQSVIGVMKVSILENSVSDILARANVMPGAVTYIQNKNGEYVSCSDIELMEAYLVGDEEPTVFDARQQPILESRIIGGKRFLVSVRAIEYTDWNLIGLIPYDDIFSKGREARNTLILLTCMLGMLASAVAYMVSRSLTKRIALLNQSISGVRHGKLDTRVEEKGKDEIGMLIRNFNYMLEQIKILMETQFKLGESVKNAELTALQAQINPHFLYNTLELVNWKAIDNDVPEISEIIQYLAKFYKISLNNGQEIIPLTTELEHVKIYVALQNLRFGNRISLVIDVTDDAYQARTLKLILQPLVENSILHGILVKRDKEGVITITGKSEGNALLITVSDDGAGMTERQALALSEAYSPGYGIRNIDQRIKLRCGSQYGLSYESSLGRGTKVTIRIAKQL